MELGRDLQLALVAEAARAPSAHNTQPARWRFLPDGGVLLFEDTTRRLVVGDPAGRDQLVGLGAAFEGLRIALSRRGLDLTDPELPAEQDPDARLPGRPELRLAARAALRRGGRPDPLAEWVFRRRTYRGPFQPADPDAIAALGVVLDAPDVTPVLERRAIRALAAENDRASFGLYARREYQAELYHWIRFSPRAPEWRRDGLTADCLGLSPLERVAGRWLFRPRLFALLARVGLHRALVAEAGRTRTASALAIFHRSRDDRALATGRRFYRLWLEITRAGFSARPMSALVDDAEATALLREGWQIPATSAPINVFAIGKASPDWDRTSPRLPAEELLV